MFPRPNSTIKAWRPQTMRDVAEMFDQFEPRGDRRKLVKEIERLVRRGSQSVRVLAQNNSDHAVDAGEVLGVDRLLIQRDENQTEWSGDLDVIGSTPRKHHRSFVVVDEPIRRGGVGEAIIEGVANVQIQYRSSTHGFATPVPDESGWLQSALSGWARIYDVDTTDRLNDEVDGNGDFVDEFPIHWARVWLNPLVNGHPVGEVIQGQLVSEMSAASWRSVRNGPSVARRDSTVALMRLYDVDHDNELFDQARFRYDVLDYIPFDQDAADAGNPHNEIVIGYDLRNGSLIQEHWPLWIIDSTGRDGIWTVDKDWENDARWDAATKRYRIPIKEKIPSVLDPDELPNEVQKIDGDLILPGADMLKGTDRHELVVNRRGFSAALNAWATAIWTGTEYEVIAVSC